MRSLDALHWFLLESRWQYDLLGWFGNCRRRSSSPFKDYADRDLGSAFCTLMSNTVLCISGQPRGLLCFYLQGDHPSEAQVDARFEFSLIVLQLCCDPLPHAKKSIVGLLTGGASIGRPNVNPSNVFGFAIDTSHPARISWRNAVRVPPFVSSLWYATEGRYDSDDLLPGSSSQPVENSPQGYHKVTVYSKFLPCVSTIRSWVSTTARTLVSRP